MTDAVAVSLFSLLTFNNWNFLKAQTLNIHTHTKINMWGDKCVN